MKHYIGLDVSMKRTFICVLNEQGKIVHEGSEKTDPHLIMDYFSKIGLKEIVVGFESGSLSHYLVTGFRERAIDPICMDARALSPILSLKINKTDKNDARGIAEALRANMYTRVHCKPRESVEISAFLVARRALINQQTQLKNTVRGLLKSYGIRLGSVGAKKFTFTVMKHLEKHEELVILGITALLSTFDHLIKEIEKIDKKMLEIVSKDIGFNFVKRKSPKSGKNTIYIFPAKRAQQNIRNRLKYLTARRAPIKPKEFIETVKPIVLGWVNYFRHTNANEAFRRLQRFINIRFRRYLTHRSKDRGFGWKKYPNSKLYAMGMIYIGSGMIEYQRKHAQGLR